MCHEVRQELCAGVASAAWHPKCEVVLHPNRASYLHAVGRGGEQTVGSSVVQFDKGRIVRRRIDLLTADARECQVLSALPHELIHIVLADLFPKTPAPRWAEEGLALLKDRPDKRARHLNDLRTALRSGSTLSLDQLFSTTRYPEAWQRAVFYGQSMSVVEYLERLGTADQFVGFLKLSQDKGHNHALKAVYDIDGTADLRQRWHSHVAGGSGQDKLVAIKPRSAAQ
jgi:hypothetical protein